MPIRSLAPHTVPEARDCAAPIEAVTRAATGAPPPPAGSPSLPHDAAMSNPADSSPAKSFFVFIILWFIIFYSCHRRLRHRPMHLIKDISPCVTLVARRWL